MLYLIYTKGDKSETSGDLGCKGHRGSFNGNTWLAQIWQQVQIQFLVSSLLLSESSVTFCRWRRAEDIFTRRQSATLEGGEGGAVAVATRRPKRETLWQRYLYRLQRLPDISAALSHDSTYQPLPAAGQRASPVCLRVSGCLADSFQLTSHFRHHMLQFPQGRTSK